MNVLYESSRWVTYTKFLATPLLVGIVLYEAFLFRKTGHFTKDVAPLQMMMMTWAAAATTAMSIFFLKRIEVTQEYLLIRELSGTKKIDYKDVEWVSEQRLVGRYNYFLKYYDRGARKSKIVFGLPKVPLDSQFLTNPFADLEVVAFLREQIAKARPDYSRNKEPSRYICFALTALSLALFFLAYLVLIR